MAWTAAELAARFEEFIGDIDPKTKKGQKRRAILEAATRMFAEQGYRQTSMDELANAVGVAKGTLYLYFPKKVDLLISCVAFEKYRWVPQLFEILEGEGPADKRLEQWVVAALLLPSRSPLICRVLEDAEMRAILADYPQDLLAQSQGGYLELMQPLLDELGGPGHRWSNIELQDRANVLQAVSWIAPMLRIEALRPGMSAERFATIFADLIVNGMRPRTRTQRDQGEES
jgi:AcrR family transcriptional regulator